LVVEAACTRSLFAAIAAVSATEVLACPEAGVGDAAELLLGLEVEPVFAGAFPLAADELELDEGVLVAAA